MNGDSVSHISLYIKEEPMATKRKSNTSGKVSVKKSDLRAAAAATELDSAGHALQGAEDLEDAAQDFAAARDLRGAAVMAGVEGVQDLTRAEDMATVAKRVGRLGQIVGEAGVTDVA